MTLERIRKHAVPEPNSGCWLWLGAMINTGYGCLRVDGKTVTAHRFAYEAVNGPIPGGEIVRHRCDVRACVNPDHLVLGTYSDNSADMVRRGRTNNRRGAESNNAKLSWDEVRIVHILVADGWAHRRIAKLFKVSHTTIGAIARGERYV